MVSVYIRTKAKEIQKLSESNRILIILLEFNVKLNQVQDQQVTRIVLTRVNWYIHLFAKLLYNLK